MFGIDDLGCAEDYPDLPHYSSFRRRLHVGGLTKARGSIDPHTLPVDCAIGCHLQDFEYPFPIALQSIVDLLRYFHSMRSPMSASGMLREVVDHAVTPCSAVSWLYIIDHRSRGSGFHGRGSSRGCRKPIAMRPFQRSR
jgi:hypothetical protein